VRRWSVVAVVVAACGSGGTGSPDAGEEPDAPVPQIDPIASGLSVDPATGLHANGVDMARITVTAVDTLG